MTEKNEHWKPDNESLTFLPPPPPPPPSCHHLPSFDINVFQKHRQNITLLSKKHDVINNVIGLMSSSKKVAQIQRENRWRYFGPKLFRPKAFSNQVYLAICVSSELLRACFSYSAELVGKHLHTQKLLRFREARLFKNGWIFEKFPKGGRGQRLFGNFP